MSVCFILRRVSVLSHICIWGWWLDTSIVCAWWGGALLSNNWMQACSQNNQLPEHEWYWIPLALFLKHFIYLFLHVAALGAVVKRCSAPSLISIQWFMLSHSPAVQTCLCVFPHASRADFTNTNTDTHIHEYSSCSPVVSHLWLRSGTSWLHSLFF